MTIFQVEDGRPYLVHNGLPVQWHTGGAPWWLMTSRMVRINKRGISFKPHAWHAREGLRGMAEWKSEPCAPSAFGLCATKTSVKFPSRQTPVVNEALDWLCGSTATYRTVTSTGTSSVTNTSQYHARYYTRSDARYDTRSDARYDTSACDVLDARSDFVWVDDTLFTGYTDLPEWIYWTVCVLIVYLVRCLSRYVLASLSKDASNNPDPVLCVSACAVCCLLVANPLQGDFLYVTEEALLYHRFTLFYVASYAALFVGNRVLNSINGVKDYKDYKECKHNKDPPFYNLLAGVMLLVASRLYCGPETPYNPPLIFIIATRMAVKSRRGSGIGGSGIVPCTRPCIKPCIKRTLTLLLDAFMVSLTCLLGFSPHSRYLIALFCAAMAASDVLV